jgi:hypothetical protein
MATPKEFANQEKVSRGPGKIFSAKNRGWLTHSTLSLSIPHPPQGRLQSPLFLIPVGVFGLQLRLDRLDFGPQRGRALRVLLLRGVQSRSRLIDGFLPACPLLLPGRLLLGLLALATLALSIVRLSRLPVRRLVRLDRRLFRLG